MSLDQDGCGSFAQLPHHAPPPGKTLIWHKIEGRGHRPPAREGHSAVSFAPTAAVYFFGGFEAGQRVNTTVSLTLTTGMWAVVDGTGADSGKALPPARAYHAACAVDSIMFVHGGEGCREESFDSGIQHRELSASPAPSVPRSLDDLYGLNTQTNEWRKVFCGLAPLPRKGHTLSTAQVLLPSKSPSESGDNFAMTECVLMFGGYSRETETYSNAVHICPALDLLSAFYSSNAAQPTSPAGSSSCSWRTLHVRGQAPCTRYSHSATVLFSRGQTYLCIFGGLDKHGGALNDLHMLDLGTLCWSQVERRTESGDWPYPVYGHVAFAAPEILPDWSIGEDTTKSANSKSSTFIGSSTCQARQLLLIFGGTGAPRVQGQKADKEDDVENDPLEASSSGCRSDLVVCDVATGMWRKLVGSMQCPSARGNAAGAICWGYSLAHPLPQPIVAGASRPSPGAMLQMISCDTRATAVEPPDSMLLPTAGVITIFGGRKESSYHADCWTLDLTWRLAGVDGFDGSVAQRTSQSMASSLNHDAITGMHYSYSTPALFPLAANATSARGLEVVETAFHRVRRERAIVDVHVARERARAEAAEALCKSQAKELDMIRDQLRVSGDDRTQESRILRGAIEEGKIRERKLMTLFNEAQKLLTVAGINQMLQSSD